MLRILVLALGMIVSLAQAGKAEPMGTAWTYQGRLMDANDTARGVYDMMFHLYDSPEGPSEIGVTDIQDVEIPDGYFTVELGFDVELFSGDWRWLEISIRPGDSNDPDGYIPLNPRQQITPTPYALYARRAGIEVPLSLTGSTDVEWIIGATNNGNGPALGGISLDGYGVRGQSTSGYGILGTNTGGKYGYLGGDEYGAYGTNNNGNYGGMGGNVYGVYGESTSGYGVLGMNTDGSYGLLGGSNNGVYGSSDSGYAGYFNGKGYFSGNVGIGTTTPAEMLHIYKSSGSIGLRVSSIATSHQYISFGATNGYSIGRASGDKFFVDWDEPLGSEALRILTIQSNGYVGIGTTIPYEKLTVVGTIKANAEYKAVDGYAYNTVGVTTYGGYFVADGNGFGVYAQCYGNDGTGVYGWGRKYDFYAGGPGTNYGAISSIRWKRNIQDIDNPLDKILQLRGVYFDWDAEHGGQHDVGMIAEEVGKVLPEIVEYEENGIDATGMDYSKLTPLLVEAVKELKKENDLLKQRIEVLERNP